MLVWQFAGLAMVIYLAGLAGHPGGARRGGAPSTARRAFVRFRQVTLPLLAPAMTVSVTLTTIHGLRVFDQVHGADRRRPGRRHRDARDAAVQADVRAGRFGYGAAFALVLTVLIAIVSLVQLAVPARRESAA